ncbi:ATP-grasp domain-containing protein [Streptomyces sp. PRKS01-65]|nr:ATP-grasp domain-containing protein [Streptomyces harenosi]NEY30955.1 ATP-grasp domain-containing protein [Streptomyces harenosi]
MSQPAAETPVEPADRPVVAIVDPFSTGAFLKDAFAEAGWRVVAVISQVPLPEIYATSLRTQDFETVVQGGGPRETAEALARIPVRAVVAGTEIGVQFADELAELLSLEGNGTALSPARRDKAAMAARLKEKGLRHVRTAEVRTEDEAVARARELGDWPVVLKPADSAGSDGVTFCESAEAVRQTFRKLHGHTNRMGLTNHKVLVQELLVGQQYFVNTVSRAGRHHVAEIWRDDRRRVEGAGLVCDAEHLLPAHGAVQDRVRSYITQVLDALGIAWGPAHSELMLTADGPVLIETAARMQGTILPAEVERATGASHVSLTVEAVTDPDAFARRAARPYDLRQHLTVLSLIAHRDGVISTPDVAERLAALPSFGGLIGDLSVGVPVQRTVDLFTSPGIVYLVGDREQVERDRAAVRALEADGLYG